MRVRGKARLAVLLSAGLVFLLGACGKGLPQDTLEPAGTWASKEYHLYVLVFWIAAFVFVLVEGLLVFALVRFRHRPGRGIPTQVHGNRRLEITWTVIPAVLMAGIAVPTIMGIFSVAARPTGNVLDITVTGHQWWWEVRYPGMGVTTANELHIPVRRPVYVTLQSVDVIHSFWVPRLAGKQDLEPGRTNHLKLEANGPGTYIGQCAEYCGLSHANMRLRVVAESEAAFDAWAAGQQQPALRPPPDVLAIMTRPGVGCNGCHTLDGVKDQSGAPFAGTVGPNLSHFAGRQFFAGDIFPVRDRGRLAAWLHNAPAAKPGADMPDFSNVLSQDDINALINYLESLK